MGIAGHVSRKMLQHYSHVRMEAKRSALDALSMKPTQRGNSGNAETEGYDQATTQNLMLRSRVCRKLLICWWS